MGRHQCGERRSEVGGREVGTMGGSKICENI